MLKNWWYSPLTLDRIYERARSIFVSFCTKSEGTGTAGQVHAWGWASVCCSGALGMFHTHTHIHTGTHTNTPHRTVNPQAANHTHAHVDASSVASPQL